MIFKTSPCGNWEIRFQPDKRSRFQRTPYPIEDFSRRSAKKVKYRLFIFMGTPNQQEGQEKEINAKWKWKEENKVTNHLQFIYTTKMTS